MMYAMEWLSVVHCDTARSVMKGCDVPHKEICAQHDGEVLCVGGVAQCATVGDVCR